VRSSRKKIGKSVGSDAKRGKATVPAAVGVERAEREAERLLLAARRIAAGLGRRAAEFQSLTEFLLGRTS
jgi:geranylgeranyl pyrophosphate synthase